jgi:hypothetical protein
MLWMMRPNLFWIIIVALFLLVYEVYFKNSSELSIVLKFKHTVLYIMLSIFIFRLNFLFPRVKLSWLVSILKQLFK